MYIYIYTVWWSSWTTLNQMTRNPNFHYFSNCLSFPNPNPNLRCRSPSEGKVGRRPYNLTPSRFTAILPQCGVCGITQRVAFSGVESSLKRLSVQKRCLASLAFREGRLLCKSAARAARVYVAFVEAT